MLYSIAYKDELQHHGILGQKWGVRRYQNEDGTLTAEGKERYRVHQQDAYKIVTGKTDTNKRIENINKSYQDNLKRYNNEHSDVTPYSSKWYQDTDAFRKQWESETARLNKENAHEYSNAQRSFLSDWTVRDDAKKWLENEEKLGKAVDTYLSERSKYYNDAYDEWVKNEKSNPGFSEHNAPYEFDRYVWGPKYGPYENARKLYMTETQLITKEQKAIEQRITDNLIKSLDGVKLNSKDYEHLTNNGELIVYGMLDELASSGYQIPFDDD